MVVVYKFLDPHGAWERLKRAVARLGRDDNTITLKGELLAAIENHVEHLSATRHGGEPFPERTGELRRGRRPGFRPEAKR